MTNDYKDLIEAIETRMYSYKLEYKGDNLKLAISLYKTNWLGNYKGIEFGLKDLRTVELLAVKQNLLHKKHQKETSKIAIINCILEEIDETLRNRPEDMARISSLLE